MSNRNDPSPDRRQFFLQASSASLSLAALTLPPLAARERSGISAAVARSEFDDLKDFVQALGRVTLLARELETRISRAPEGQRKEWGASRVAVRDMVAGAEDAAVAALRRAFAAKERSPAEFAVQLRDRTQALTEAQQDLEIILKQAAAKLERAIPKGALPKEAPQKSGSRPTSPLIIIANPFEEILYRNGSFDMLASLAKQGLDAFASQAWGEGKLSQRRDWKWRLETKRMTRPQDVEAERAYEAVRNGLVSLASIDALTRAVDAQPGRARDPQWREAKGRVSERVSSVEQQLREGFEESLERTTRVQGLQRLKEASSRIGLASSVVEAFLK